MKQRWTTIHLSLWLLSIPVLFVPTWNPWLTAVTLLLLFGLRLAAKRWTGQLFPSTLIDPFVVIYLFLAAVAMWISPLPQQGIAYFIILAAGVFGYYATVDWLITPARQRLLFMALSVGGSAIALFGFFMLEWPSRYVVDLQFITDKLPHLGDGFTIHHNEMAGLMALLLPISLFLPKTLMETENSTGSNSRSLSLSKAKADGARTALASTNSAAAALMFTKKERMLLTTTAVIMAAMLLFTQSRNAWFALLISVFAYKIWGRFRTRWMLLITLLWMLLPLGFVMLRSEQQHYITEQMMMMDEVTKGDDAAGKSLVSRLEIWSAAKQTIWDYPVVGAGWAAFEPVSRMNYVYNITLPTFPISHAHNLFLQTAVNTGIAGLLTAVLLWLTTMAHLWRREGENGGITAVLGASFTAYLAFNAFDSFTWEKHLGIVVWLLLAVGMTAVSIKKPLSKAYSFVPVLLFLFLLLTPLLPRNFAHIQLDKARLDGGMLAEASVFANDNRRIGIAYWLRGEQEKALAHWLADEGAIRFLVGQGQQSFVAEEWETAVSWHTAALIIDPMDGFAYYERGLAHESAQIPVRALADYEQATVLIPSTYPVQQAEAWEGAGRLYIYYGEWKNAAFAFTQANALVPDWPDYQQQLQDVNQMLQEMDLQP